MLRVKLPSGHLTPAKLRAVGEVSNLFGRGDGELTTRQCVQLHWLELAKLPEVFAHLDGAGITTAGGCGDTVRNVTGCPLQGHAHDELFDARRSSRALRRTSSATPTSPTCRGSTSTRSRRAPSVATRRRSTTSPSSA